MCALLLWFLWGSSDAFSIFIHIHPKELREGGKARLVLDRPRGGKREMARCRRRDAASGLDFKARLEGDK